jgi:hypothetical protein
MRAKDYDFIPNLSHTQMQARQITTTAHQRVFITLYVQLKLQLAKTDDRSKKPKPASYQYPTPAGVSWGGAFALGMRVGGCVSASVRASERALEIAVVRRPDVPKLFGDR